MTYPLWQEISFYLNEFDKEKAEFESKSISVETLNEIRRRIAALVEQFKTVLEARLEKKNASDAVFAIVALIDEEMQKYDYSKVRVRWDPLQKDFFSAFTAGEVFFEHVDKILEDPSIPQVVFEVYYFVLKRGFKGKYRDSKMQLYKYLELLKDKIQVSSPKTVQRETPASFVTKEKNKKLKYYMLSLATFVMTYLALYIYSNFDR